jgi:hypothetical protein
MFPAIQSAAVFGNPRIEPGQSGGWPTEDDAVHGAAYPAFATGSLCNVGPIDQPWQERSRASARWYHRGAQWLRNPRTTFVDGPRPVRPHHGQHRRLHLLGISGSEVRAT